MEGLEELEISNELVFVVIIVDEELDEDDKLVVNCWVDEELVDWVDVINVGWLVEILSDRVDLLLVDSADVVNVDWDDESVEIVEAVEVGLAVQLL